MVQKLEYACISIYRPVDQAVMVVLRLIVPVGGRLCLEVI